MQQNDGSWCKNSNGSGGGPNVWFVPFPHVTHFKCFFSFALQLARQGLSIRFFCFDAEIRRASEPETQFLLDGLSFQFHSCDSMLGDVDPSSHLVRGHVGVNAVHNAVVEFMKSELQSGRKPACLISDLWFSLTRDVAAECGIPAWLLSPYSSVYLSVVSYIAELESKGILNLPNSPSEEGSREEIISFPGVPLLRIHEIPHFYFNKNSAICKAALRNARSIAKCDVILLTSFYELESSSFREFERFIKSVAAKNGREILHILHVGPTFHFLLSSKDESRLNLLQGGEEKHPTIKFLDSQAASSVLLVIFGTLVNFSEEQMVEIALGLENSNQPFLCALNSPLKGSGVGGDDVFSVIPADCVERTRGRGLFVQGWVPQLQLLAHPATGGFVSHCGFNSILESLSAGVPILAWPHATDQFVNCRFIVDEAHVAIEVHRGPGAFVDREEVERSVKALFHTEEGAIVRKRAHEMRDLAAWTVGEKGTTRENIHTLVALIRGQVT
ncbi:hypothetical protein R1flu_002711 [Riccia fluitans]|uniref:Glycosyltransferase n=1 Tax=Riccia fluitans TaxID=41844 RepID=A0ABD1Y6X2_9MARC